MKRFLAWFALTLVGMVLLMVLTYQSRQSVTLSEPQVVRPVDAPEGRVRKVYIERHGAVIELVRDVEVNDDDRDFDRKETVVREPAEGLPVPVVPGSRTTEARAEPPSPAPPAPRRTRRWSTTEVAPPKPPDVRSSPGLTTVTGRLSATEERARDDARRKFERMLGERLAPEVPTTWKAPRELVDGMIREIVIVPRERDYGTVYEATLKVDLSPASLARVVDAYHREEVVKRLAVLGALLAFVLVCLAVVSGYINADEATKGYYTTRLRLAAAAGVGAAGVVLYRMLA